MAEEVQPLLLGELSDSGFLLAAGLCHGRWESNGFELRALVGRFDDASKLAETVEIDPQPDTKGRVSCCTRLSALPIHSRRTQSAHSGTRPQGRSRILMCGGQPRALLTDYDRI